VSSETCHARRSHAILSSGAHAPSSANESVLDSAATRSHTTPPFAIFADANVPTRPLADWLEPQCQRRPSFPAAPEEPNGADPKDGGVEPLDSEGND
jgi:hypothetical protein